MEVVGRAVQRVHDPNDGVLVTVLQDRRVGGIALLGEDPVVGVSPGDDGESRLLGCEVDLGNEVAGSGLLVCPGRSACGDVFLVYTSGRGRGQAGGFQKGRWIRRIR
jgi:hypothetical protein